MDTTTRQAVELAALMVMEVLQEVQAGTADGVPEWVEDPEVLVIKVAVTTIMLTAVVAAVIPEVMLLIKMTTAAAAAVHTGVEEAIMVGLQGKMLAIQVMVK